MKCLYTKLVKQLSDFVKDNIGYLLSYDEIRVYYDNGQNQLVRIIHNTFQTLLNKDPFGLLEINGDSLRDCNPRLSD